MDEESVDQGVDGDDVWDVHFRDDGFEPRWAPTV